MSSKTEQDAAWWATTATTLAGIVREAPSRLPEKYENEIVHGRAQEAILTALGDAVSAAHMAVGGHTCAQIAAMPATPAPAPAQQGTAAPLPRPAPHDGTWATTRGWSR